MPIGDPLPVSPPQLTDFSHWMARCQQDRDGSALEEMERAWLACRDADLPDDMAAWAAFFWRNVHILRRKNGLLPLDKTLLQRALEDGKESQVTRAARVWLAAGNGDGFRLEKVSQPRQAENRSRLLTFEGHQGAVEHALRLDDATILSHSSREAILWDGATGRARVILTPGEDGITGIFPAGGDALVSWAKHDRVLWVWNRADGRLRHRLTGHFDEIEGALPLADGTVVSWSEDATLRVWDPGSGECLHLLKGHAGAVHLVFVRENGVLVSVGQNSEIVVWEEFQMSRRLQGHRDLTYEGTLLPNGRLLLWGGVEGFHVRDLETDGVDFTLSGEGGRDRIAVLPNGNLITWCRWRDEGSVILVWNGRTGEKLAELAGHADDLLQVTPLPDGRVISCSGDGTVRLWQPETGQCLRVFEGHPDEVLGARLLDDGRLVSWSRQGTLLIHDLASGARLATLTGHGGTVVNGVLPLDRGRLLSWGGDRRLHVWDPALATAEEGAACHRGAVSGLLPLPSGNILSWSGWDQDPRLWDLATGGCKRVFRGHARSIHGLLLLPGERFVTWGFDPAFRVWDAAHETCLAQLPCDREAETGALLLRDGRLLTWPHDGGGLRVWETTGWRCVATLEGHLKEVAGARELASGLLLTWSGDTTLRLWDLSRTEKGERSGAVLSLREARGEPPGIPCLQTLEGHREKISGVLEMVDGTLLTWSGDNHLGFWDPESGDKGFLSVHDAPLGGGLYQALPLSESRFLILFMFSPARLIELADGRQEMVLTDVLAYPAQARRLDDGTFMIQSPEGALQVRDTATGKIVDQADPATLARARPDLLRRWQEADPDKANETSPAFIPWRADAVVGLSRPDRGGVVVAWQGEARCSAGPLLLADGVLVTGDSVGAVQVLRLHHGLTPVSWEALQASAGAPEEGISVHETREGEGYALRVGSYYRLLDRAQAETLYAALGKALGRSPGEAVRQRELLWQRLDCLAGLDDQGFGHFLRTIDRDDLVQLAAFGYEHPGFWEKLSHAMTWSEFRKLGVAAANGQRRPEPSELLMRLGMPPAATDPE